MLTGKEFLIRRWKLGCHLHIVPGQPWSDWWQTEWGRWRKWTEWFQEPNLEERLFWAGLWRIHPDQISRIRPSETDRTRATLEHCHRHHTLSEVEQVKSSDQWCRRQHWGRATREAWIPPRSADNLALFIFFILFFYINIFMDHKQPMPQSSSLYVRWVEQFRLSGQSCKRTGVGCNETSWWGEVEAEPERGVQGFLRYCWD